MRGQEAGGGGPPRRDAQAARPNVYIIGTPKSGTSSLFNWLCTHPSVIGTIPKEPFFLLDADNPLLNPERNVHVDGDSVYESAFARPEQAAIRVDGCCQYLYSRTAIEFVRSSPAPATLIALLRDPTERVRSGFEYFAPKGPLIDRRADLLSMTERWLGATNGEGRLAKSDRYDYLLRNLVRHSEYARYLEPWRDALDSTGHRLLLRTFEQVSADPRSFLAELSGLLGIDETWWASTELERANATRRPRSQTVSNWVGGSRRRFDGRVTRSLERLDARFNNRGPRRTPRDAAAASLLRQHFEPFNQSLEAEFGIDVSPWSARAS